MHNISNTKTISSIVLFTTLFLLVGCSAKRAKDDIAAESAPSDSQRIESLSQALSRAQSRIEELDAKVSSMTDKYESTKLTVDNLTNAKGVIATTPVGSADEHDIEVHEKKTAKKKTTPVAVVAAPSKVDSVEDNESTMAFLKAMNLFKAGKYSDAELAFNHFTETYPEQILAGSAQFYAGESYFKMGEYKLAIAEYEKVLTTFANSPRAASAMVRISHCHVALGATKEADRSMSLARALYDGNPSLDWSGTAVAQKKSTLEAEPMGTETDAKE